MELRDKERAVLDEALVAFEEATGAKVKVLPKARRGKELGADAILEIRINGRVQAFVAEVKTADRIQAIGHIKARFEEMAPHFPALCLLLITPYMTLKMADECRKRDLCYLDTAGNAYLKAEGVFIFLTGRPKPPELKKTYYRTNTQAGLKVVFALICKHDLLAHTYRDIGTLAGVTLGTIGPILKDLEQRRFVRRTKDGGLILQNKRQLFDEWVALYPATLRPKLEVRRYRFDPSEATYTSLRQLHTYWGGEMAAQILTGHLRAELFTIYYRERLPELLTKLRMRLDPGGNAEILRAFWPVALDITKDPVVPPILAYADLMTTGSARNEETAKLIYERFIETALTEDRSSCRPVNSPGAPGH